jgi:hypothetical protein
LSQALKPKADNGDQGGNLPPNPPPFYGWPHAKLLLRRTNTQVFAAIY